LSIDKKVKFLENISYIGAGDLKGGYRDKVIALSKRINEFTLISPINSDEREIRGEKVYITPLNILFLESLSFNIKLLLKRFHKRNIDIIMTSNPFYLPSAFIIKLKSKSKPKLILEVITLPVGWTGFFLVLTKLIFDFIIYLSRYFCDGIIVQSQNLENYIYRIIGNKIPIKTIYPGVDCNRFNPNNIPYEDIENLKKSLNIPLENVIVMYHGAISIGRGIDTMIKSFSEVLKKDSKVSFIIIGDGNYLDKAKNLVKRLGIEEHMLILGSVPFPKLPEYIALADICIVPLPENNNWSISYKLLESMAMAKPVIATDINVNRIVDPESRYCYFVPPDDPIAMGNAIIYLIKEKDRRKSMGIKAREYIKENFTWEKCVDLTLEFIENLKRNG